MSYSFIQHIFFLLLAFAFFIYTQEQEAPTESQNTNQDSDTSICGGFLEFESSFPDLKKQIDYSLITVQSFTMEMVLKESTNLAASGYYFLPVYENEPFILKITGPYGMSFEPEQYVFTIEEDKGVKDHCAGDINFKFLGFSIQGQISTFGSNEGPIGINLALYNAQNKQIQSTLTTESGLFKFKPLYPQKGEYVIKPINHIEMFDPKHNAFKFNININKDNFFERALIIRGYKLTGRVITEQGSSMENALIAIYTHNTTLIKDYSCKHKYLSSNNNNNDDLLYKQMFPFCLISSNKEGKFSFVNIPYGKFTIRPLYKNDFLSYSLHPEQIDIDIKHEDLIIEEPFKVTTFSIYGRVIDVKKKGIPNVTIKVDGQVKAITDKNGIYILENIAQGNYDLEAQTDNMFFEPLTNIQITPHLEKIQDVQVTDYRLCGKITIEATDYFSISKRTVVLQDIITKKERRTITDQGGKYCFEVKPGNYHVYPVLTQEEKNSDLHLQPESHDLSIVDAPVLDANFYQSKVKVNGKIICKKKCDKDISIKLISSKNDKLQSAKINHDFSFEFENILSGQYKLAIIKPEWCWEKEDIVIKVQNVDITNLNFKQIGYSLFYTSQYDIDILWNNVNTGNSEKVSLDKSKEKICLPNEGKHSITPQSCYMFKEKSYDYDTNNTIILEFIPTEFRTRGKIELDNEVISQFKNENITTTEVILEIEEIDTENYNKRKPYKKLHIKLENKNTNFFYFFSKPNTQYSITPLFDSKYTNLKAYNNILFIPKQRKISVKEECNEDPNAMIFSLKSGVIIEGKVTPSIEDILITAYTKIDNIQISNARTDINGKYKIGPLSKEEQYEIKAEKEGFRFMKSDKVKYDFIAEKLSFLKVFVQDTTGKPLSGVFLSLSSSDRGFRINNNTNAEGYFNFIELYSGEYYIKPLFKEYEFDQQQKLITIKGGEHYNITLTARRVAFSVFGKVNTLNKEKIEGLYVQSVNQKTKQIQETSIDKNGEYRLKGLIPGESYFIRVKISSALIEKALPQQIPITLGKEDFLGVDFVVLYKSKTIDVRAYLNFTDEEDHCPYEKIKNTFVDVSRPDEDDEYIIKTITVSNACQFVMRNLNKVKYHFRVYEKNKSPKGNKMIIEHTVDLSNEREINNGVKVVEIDISNLNKQKGDVLNYTIYSPLFLFLMIISILKWDYTLWVFKNFIGKPFNFISGLFGKKR